MDERAAGDPWTPLFLVSWAVLMASVFGSVLAQWHDVFGPAGLFPIASGVHPPSWMFPSLLAVVGSDVLARAVAWSGLAASVAALIPRTRPAAFGLAAACWWQLSVSSPFALGMPPDILVLHGTVAAALLSAPATARWGRWFGLAVLAKLYVEAGLSKLVYPDGAGFMGWLFGGFPTSFFEVAALPSPLAAWWASWMTPGLHRAGAAVVVLGQVLGGLAVFGGTRVRWAAFGFLSAFQVVLLSAANFGALCWGSLVLGLFLVMRPATGPGGGGRLGRWVFAGWLGAQGVQVGIDVVDAADTSVAGHVLRGWRVATRYTMFMQMPPERVAWRIMVHPADGGPVRVAWPSGQPALDAPPAHVLFTHHPRLTFMRWFGSTIGGREVARRATTGFASSEPNRDAWQARDWAAWACVSEPAGTRVSLHTEVLRLQGGGRRAWHVQPLGSAGPVPCGELVGAPRWWDAVARDPGIWH